MSDSRGICSHQRSSIMIILYNISSTKRSGPKVLLERNNDINSTHSNCHTYDRMITPKILSVVREAKRPMTHDP